MDINELVLTDAALAVIDQGEWIEAGAAAPGVEFLVTGMQSVEAQKLMKEKQVKARQKNRGKPLTEEQFGEITKEVLVESVLKDWRGLTDGGKELPYSKEMATKFIMSRGGERFSVMIMNAAARLDVDANSYVEGVAKN